tara:strand:- start:1742 stop:2509 length:768 start_codon:yes stop_codon:yes gene_type:complete
MKQPLFLSLLFVGSLVSNLFADEVRPLDDLGQWTYDPALWEIKDGVATGTTTEETGLPYNKFLIWNGGELADFDLSVKLKVEGNNNSGIQYRSKRRDELGEFVVSGYQCDAHPSNDYCAMMYEEKGRGIVATRGQKVVITPEGKKMLVGNVGKAAEVDLSKWNTYEIQAKGNHIIHKLNGIVTAEVIDLEAGKRALSGVLAFQVHRGPKMEVQIKDLVIKHTSGGKILEPGDVSIPANAEQVHGPKPKPAPKKQG